MPAVIKVIVTIISGTTLMITFAAKDVVKLEPEGEKKFTATYIKRSPTKGNATRTACNSFVPSWQLTPGLRGMGRDTKAQSIRIAQDRMMPAIPTLIKVDCDVEATLPLSMSTMPTTTKIMETAGSIW
jgi:hypothetical protein